MRISPSLLIGGKIISDTLTADKSKLVVAMETNWLTSVDDYGYAKIRTVFKHL